MKRIFGNVLFELSRAFQKMWLSRSYPYRNTLSEKQRMPILLKLFAHKAPAWAIAAIIVSQFGELGERG